MNWNELWTNFLEGKPDAILAIFSILGFLITSIGVFYVAITFNQQKKINALQHNFNQLAVEKDRRELFPWFTGESSKKQQYKEQAFTEYNLILKENKALDVEIFPFDNSGRLLSPLYGISQVVIPGEDRVFTTVKVKNMSIENRGAFVKQYLLYYHDQVGRPYTQELGHDGNKVVLLYPQVVSMDFRKNIKISPR